MNTLTILGIAISLAMDAFAVSLVAGATITPLTRRHYFRLGWHFGLFQFMMPVIGWVAGCTVIEYLEKFDHWIAFGLLTFIGGKMIYESFHPVENFDRDISRGWTLIGLSIATSIDALAVGFSLALLGISIWIPALVIGVVAALLTLTGMLLGRKIGALWGPRVEIAGGIVLCAIGLKILVDHLFQP